MKILERDNDLMLFGLDKTQSSLKGACVFILVYLLASFFAAVLTPLLYWLTEYFHNIYTENETFIYLLDKGVDKYYDRLRWLGIIIGLPYIFKYCGLNSIKSMGLSLDKGAKLNFLKYFALGTCIMIFIYALQFIFTDVEFKGISPSQLPSAFLSAALGGITLGILEELIFRGLIFRCFYTAWGVLPATLLSSLFFAYKHFKVPSCVWENLDLHTAHWDTGFAVAYYDSVGMFMNFSPLKFISLTVLAIFLCTLYLKTKNLYSCIGFHTSVVFLLKLHREFFIVKEDDLRNFFGNSAVTNSYISIIILSILMIFSIFSLKKRRDFS